MERSRLIQLAPDYYTIAICNFFDGRDVASSNTIWTNTKILHSPLFWYVLNSLVAKNMLAAIKDDFGPTIYRRTPTFRDQWKALQIKEDTPYSRFALDPQRESWINTALEAVNKELETQKIKTEDFQKPDAEWEPLPVERSNAKLKAATEKLDETIDAVEADNGYSATLPEEKTYVVENLKDGSSKLKEEDAISYAYLKRKVLDPLDILIRRFAGAAVGLVAQAARQAILEWLKDLGQTVLHWIV
jgi:hypothetical protein